MKTKHIFATTMILTSPLLTGCTSLQEIIKSGVDSNTGVPMSYIGSDFGDKQAKKLAQIINFNTGKMGSVFTRVYKPEYPDSSLEITKEKVNDSEFEIKFSWESPKGFFPLGVYDITKTQKHNRSEPVAFTDFVVSGINEMVGDVHKAGANYELHAYYIGQADGVPIRKGGLMYKGEYGDIFIPQSKATLNGVPHTFKIKKGQYISNSELAALRAYSFRYFVHQTAMTKQINDHFDVMVTDNVGNHNRYAKLVLKIKANNWITKS